jgi:hypothetical protein
MKQALGIIAMIIGAVAGKTAVRAAFAPDVKSEKFLSRIAEKTNEGLPMMVDSETQLLNTTAAPALFTYHYKLVNVRAAELDLAALDSILGQQVRSGSCSNADTRKILDAGVTMRYSYVDRDGGPVADLDVTAAHCP